MPMRQSRFTEEHIAFALKQTGTGPGFERADLPTAGRSSMADSVYWRLSA